LLVRVWFTAGAKAREREIYLKPRRAIQQIFLILSSQEIFEGITIITSYLYLFKRAASIKSIISNRSDAIRKDDTF